MALSQNYKTGSWNIASLNYHLSDKFIIYAEAQARSQSFSNDFFYHELKGGLTYNLPKKSSVLVAFGNYETYTFPGDFKMPVTTNEYRIWEQFVMNNEFSRLRLEHRYRVEQRWINGEFFNRFRYRLNPVIALNHPTIISHTFYISVFDEVFFTSRGPYFIRNRIFGGAGYQFNNLFTLQTGFIRQFDYRTADDGSGKNFIQTFLFFNINHTKTKTNVHFSNTD